MWKNLVDSSVGMLSARQDPALPTVLLIHGAGGNAETLGAMWQALAPCCNLAAINLPGRKAPHECLDNISALASYAMGFIAGSATCKPWLVGHSLGAAIAVQAASKWQDKLAGLILCNAAANLPLNNSFMMRLASNMPHTMDIFLRKAYGPTASADLLAAGIRLLNELPRQTIIDDFKACRTYNAMPYLEQIRLPVLILSGLNDVITRASEGQLMADIMPNARLVAIASAGHMGPYEMPERFAQEIIDFVQTQ